MKKPRPQTIKPARSRRAPAFEAEAPAFYTYEAAADLLSTTPEELLRLVEAGKLKSVHLTGSMKRITADSLERYREAHRRA